MKPGMVASVETSRTCTQGQAPARQLDGVVLTALLYLQVPVVIFVLGWVRPVWAWPACAAWFAGIGLLLSRIPRGTWLRGLSPASFIVPLVVGGLWSALGGAGHLFYANRYDWVVRDAVLRDLAAGTWPIGYTEGGQLLILRAPIGFYLPAALLAKLTSRNLSDLFLLGWETLGVVLVLRLVCIGQSWRRNLAAAIIVVLFSGLDILGWLLTRGTWPRFTQTLEWWAGSIQYSSNTTLLFWVPNHTLAAWIGSAILYRYRGAPGVAPFLPYMLVATAICAPFAVVGLLPFLVVAVLGWRNYWRSLWPELPLAMLSLGIASIVFIYLTADAARVPSSGLRVPWSDFQGGTTYVIFSILEWALLWCLLRTSVARVWAWSTAIFLAVLPCFHLGAANDLVMRGSIPALFLLCIFLVDGLALEGQATDGTKIRTWIGAVLLLGAMTAGQEVARSLLRDRWPASISTTLQDWYPEGLPSHYVASMSTTALKWILIRPTPVPPGPSRVSRPLSVED